MASNATIISAVSFIRYPGMLPDVKRFAAVLLLVVALPATGEFAVVEETETMTVYREGDHVIVLVDASGGLDVFGIMMGRAPEPPVSTPIRDKESRDAGVRTYWSRIR